MDHWIFQRLQLAVSFIYNVFALASTNNGIWSIIQLKGRELFETLNNAFVISPDFFCFFF